MARADADQIRACRWTSLLAEIKYFSGNVDTAAGLVRAQRMAATNLPYASRERYLDGKEIPTGG